MAGQSTIFPIFLRAEYKEGGAGFQRFQSDAMRAAQAASGEIKKVGAALDGIFSARRSGGSLDLGVGGLKAAIDAQRQLAVASREVADATLRAAQSNGGFDASLRRTAAAALQSAKAQEAELLALQQKLPLLERVQAELSQTASAASALTGENLRLAQAEAGAANGATMLAAIYRGTSAELGRVAISARESAGAFELLFQAQDARSQAAGQAFFNAAAGLDRQTKSARESAAAFEALFADQEKTAVSARRVTDTYLSLAQAEAAAVNGANMVASTLRGTALEQDRVTKSAQESARAFQEAFAAQQAASDAAAAALREQAAAVAALKAQINPAAAATEQFNQKLAFAKAALDRGELSQREYAAAVKLASAALREAGQAEVAAMAARNGLTTATRQGTTARKSVINSVGAERTAFIQLGQQLQDMTVQAQMGTNAFIIMGQQLPQVAFALSGLEDSANKTKAAVGRVATFLSGPWGAAVFVGLAVLGPFVQKLLESAFAADSASDALAKLVDQKIKSAAEARVAAAAEETFAKTLDGVRDAAFNAEKALTALENRQKSQAEQTVANIQASIASAKAINNESIALLNAAEAQNERRKSGLAAADPRFRSEFFVPESNLSALREQIKGSSDQLDILLPKLRRAQVQVAVDDGLAGQEGAIKRRYEAEVEGLRKSAIQRGLSVEQIEREAAAIKAREQAAMDALKPGRGTRNNRSGAAAERSRIAAANQLATFSEKAAEQIQRINERFDQQPRLIDQASQATRQLDAIIAELAERKPANFQALIEDAQQAKGVIEDAIQRPIEDILRRSEERLQIERLIAQGRIDEAAALQEIQRLQEQIGDLTDEQVDDIREQIRLEQQKTRELRAQNELMELQADVARTVADDLRNVFSGRGTFGDLLKNFQQSLRDLQGARLFEDLFGPAFREIEEELRGNTPQGRANARATKEIDTFAGTASVAEKALASLSAAFAEAANGLRAPAANDNNTGGVQILPDGSMVVTGAAQKDEVEIARKSVIDIAKQVGNEVGAGFASVLEDVLSPQQLQLLGQTIGGFIAGKALGGTAGGIFGALEGFTANIKGLEKISGAFGKFLEAAATAQQVNEIGNALGIRGSKTGATIGGVGGQALGTLIGGPIGGKIGALIGSTLGNAVGGLLKGTPRGSANIGGVGGGLGITGVVGNSSSLRTAASGFGGSVLDQINDLARQLGATVNGAAGRVSIGQRKGNIRVDPSGRGATKIGNGAIDFGEDSEAAIAFAVQNLIQDGVITGLRAAENRLLQAGNDISAAIQDVLTFRSVFDRLKEIKDPVGFAVDQLNREFTNLIDLFTRAGASAEELAALEELYGLERVRAIEAARDGTTDALRQLLADLRTGDNGLSLRTRQGNALTQFNGLAARVQAGDTAAFDEFAEVSQQLLEIERQLFGSTQSYFDRLSQITNLTEQAIAGQGNVVGIGADLPSPFNDGPVIDRSIDTMNANLGAKLDAINDNLILLNPRSTPQPIASGFGSGIINSAIGSLQIARF